MNVIHSIDAYVLRNMHRRCNYDPVAVQEALQTIQKAKEYYSLWGTYINAPESCKHALAIDRYIKTNIVDTSAMAILGEDTYMYFPEDILHKLEEILLTILEHEPFEIVTIHDEFQAHPNNLNHLRAHYRNILADLADSTIVSDILTQLYGQQVNYPKQSTNLSAYIMNSNYFLS